MSLHEDILRRKAADTSALPEHAAIRAHLLALRGDRAAPPMVEVPSLEAVAFLAPCCRAVAIVQRWHYNTAVAYGGGHLHFRCPRCQTAGTVPVAGDLHRLAADMETQKEPAATTQTRRSRQSQRA
jgi:hypothetical protein